MIDESTINISFIFPTSDTHTISWNHNNANSKQDLCTKSITSYFMLLGETW